MQILFSLHVALFATAAATAFLLLPSGVICFVRFKKRKKNAVFAGGCPVIKKAAELMNVKNMEAREPDRVISAAAYTDYEKETHITFYKNDDRESGTVRTVSLSETDAEWKEKRRNIKIVGKGYGAPPGAAEKNEVMYEYEVYDEIDDMSGGEFAELEYSGEGSLGVWGKGGLVYVNFERLKQNEKKIIHSNSLIQINRSVIRVMLRKA